MSALRNDPVPPEIEEWRVDTLGRRYAPKGGGRSGVIKPISDEETVAEARARGEIKDALKDAAKDGVKKARRGPGRPKGKGRRPDPTPPGESRKQPTAKPAVTPEQLSAALEIPLLIPMLAARHLWHCDYCAENFKRTAPAAAKDIVDVAVSTGNPYLLKLLESWQALVSMFLGARGMEGLAMYAGPPFLHHFAPQPVYDFAGPLLGVPPRPAKPPAHQHGPRRAETQDPRFASAPPPAAAGPVSTPPGPAAAPNPFPPLAGPADVAAAAMANGETEAARARETQMMAEREAMRARQAAAMAAEQMARRGARAQPNIPPYAAQRAPGTPQAPPTTGDGGSPLPPEADDV